MKMQSDKSSLNFGDTSFRRKRYMEEYKKILLLLSEHMDEYKSWVGDNESQIDFYSSVISETDLFDRTEKDDSKLAKRSRTLTNSMIKSGLISNERVVSEVGLAWINNELMEPDLLESMLSINDDNLVFFRQWSKFRLFSPGGKSYFSPFLYALKFLAYNEDLPQKHFISILHSIHPDTSEEKLNLSIEKYKLVANQELSFSNYYEDYIVKTSENGKVVDSATINNLLSSNINQLEFNKYFTNRKSQSNVEKEYKGFVESIIAFKLDKTIKNLAQLKTISSNSKVKKAFGFRSIPFKFNNLKGSDSISKFLEDNEDNLLLSDDLYQIYVVFTESKREDLIKEYGDLTIRLLNLSGVLKFEHSFVNLTYKEIFYHLFEDNKVALNGVGSFEDYERNLKSTFYKNNTFLSFLSIKEKSIKKSLNRISENLNLSDISDLPSYYKNQQLVRLNNLIADNFDVEKTIEILSNINSRNDERVSELVTDSASIPTIFEYILTIAWYHMSDRNFNIYDAFNLSLDGSMLPLTHATGYKGDIEIKDTNPSVILEATLMDKNNQKRNELEPVIRHSVNFAIEQQPTKSLGIFVANVIDDNVSNIFRACSKIELYHSRNQLVQKGIDITPFTISEIISMLKKNIKVKDIIEVINKHSHNADFVEIGWRDNIVTSILKKQSTYSYF